MTIRQAIIKNIGSRLRTAGIQRSRRWSRADRATPEIHGPARRRM